MTTFAGVIGCAVLLLAPGPARPQDPSTSPPSDAPTETPSAPPENPPAPPTPQRAPAAQSSPQGQWVYTQQYGWVWMPYSDVYTYVPPDGYGEPYMYVYYPAYGWSWLVAPWVWGWGPWPFFGIHGAWRFGWYGHGWWRSPWRWHHYGYGRPGFGGRFAYHGFAPAPSRGFVGHAAPAARPFAGGGGFRGGFPARGGGGFPARGGGGFHAGGGGRPGGHR